MFLDLLIILTLIYSVARNWHSGFIRQFSSAAGFFIGLLLGRWLTNFTLSIAHSPANRSLITIITIFGIAIVGLTVGEYVGIKLNYSWLKSKFNDLDNIFGSIFTFLTVLLSIWLIASIVDRLPSQSIKADLNKSKILTALNNVLPPAPKIISDLSHLIDPNGFPDVFVGSEPIPKNNINLPGIGDFQTAVKNDEASVVRIQGLGCGGLVSGSGFVVANNLVATNAHVIAGITNPIVEDSHGRHSAIVIWFDSNLDLAVLKTHNLAGSPLPIDTVDKSSST
ncbi:MAG TPA: CvpA family protein, partial [Patescibacteria group bacterium]|nr:CvpA family protein [Patescibacteria group bacterium]